MTEVSFFKQNMGVGRRLSTGVRVAGRFFARFLAAWEKDAGVHRVKPRPHTVSSSGDSTEKHNPNI